MTVQTPMTMPTIVRNARSLWARSAMSAKRRFSTRTRRSRVEDSRDHSNLNASIGVSRLALIAGKTPAMTPVSVARTRPDTTRPGVTRVGSGVKASTQSATTQPKKTPSAPPPSARRPASRRNWKRTSRFFAPTARTRLALADEALLRGVNRAIAAGRVKNKGGEAVTVALEAGLLREDRAILYPVVDQIPILLVDAGIPLDQVDGGRPRTKA